jgi:hypothetical protein
MKSEVDTNTVANRLNYENGVSFDYFELWTVVYPDNCGIDERSSIGIFCVKDFPKIFVSICFKAD